MSELVITTYDWVPEAPRGFVRDLRIRWACEEAGLPYRVEATPFKDRGPKHYAHQPFAQVPWLIDGDLSIFETGAILLHLGEKSEKLMPRDEKGRSETIEWVFAALNSTEMASVPWSIFHFMGQAEGQMFDFFDNFVRNLRVTRIETVLSQREWLAAGQFSIADILMVDVLRLIDRFKGLEGAPLCKAYVERGTSRPAFTKAHADQLAHYAKAD
ncbi:MAG: glutathione S-transferase family protein [Hyphomonadaceae bacterium]